MNKRTAQVLRVAAKLAEDGRPGLYVLISDADVIDDEARKVCAEADAILDDMLGFMPRKVKAMSRGHAATVLALAAAIADDEQFHPTTQQEASHA